MAEVMGSNMCSSVQGQCTVVSTAAIMTAVMRSNEQQCRISCFPGLLEILSQVIYPKLLQHHRPRAGTAVHHPTLPKNWNHLVCNDIINMYVVMCSNVKYCDRACDIRGFECMGSFTD